MRTTLFVLLALLVVACQRESADLSQNPPPQSTTTTATMPPGPDVFPTEKDEPSSRPTVAPAAHEVHLIEYQIHMPQTLRAGRVAFNVENGGKEDHAFEIEGNGIEEKTEILKRGNTATLEVDLKPGTYTVYCPVKNHKDKGMKVTLRVE